MGDGIGKWGKAENSCGRWREAGKGYMVGQCGVTISGTEASKELMEVD